jgi:hypothetical protein
VIVSREVILQKTEFGVKYWDFDAFEPVFLADIRYSTYGAIVISCVECTIKFCIEW